MTARELDALLDAVFLKVVGFVPRARLEDFPQRRRRK